MKKIMFVIPTLKVGGTELFLFRLCKSVSRQYEIQIVVIGEPQALGEKFVELGVNVAYLRCTSLLQLPVAVIRLRRLINRFKPNILHSFLYISDIISGFASIGARDFLTIWSLRGAELPAKSSKRRVLTQFVAARMSKYFPDIIISCGKVISKFHISLGYPKSKIIEIGNFASDWAQERNPKSIFFTEDSPSEYTVGLAARFDPGKGHINLVFTVCRFVLSHPGVRRVTVTFAGKGCESKGKLNQILESFEIIALLIERDRISLDFCGLLDELNLIKWYEKVDVYFMASESEGFPNSLIDAVNMGIPTLSNPAGDSQAIVHPVFLGDSASVQSMAKLLHQFYSMPAKVRLQKSRDQKQEFLSKYQKDIVIRRYKKIWSN